MLSSEQRGSVMSFFSSLGQIPDKRKGRGFILSCSWRVQATMVGVLGQQFPCARSQGTKMDAGTQLILLFSRDPSFWDPNPRDLSPWNSDSHSNEPVEKYPQARAVSFGTQVVPDPMKLINSINHTEWIEAAVWEEQVCLSSPQHSLLPVVVSEVQGHQQTQPPHLPDAQRFITNLVVSFPLNSTVFAL